MVSSKNKIKWDLGWGNPYFLLEILDIVFKEKLSYQDVASMSYSPDLGIPELIKKTREVIRLTTGGLVYDHVVITAGATQAINSILKHYSLSGVKKVLTTQYGFPFYDSMISNLGMKRLDFLKPQDSSDHIYLIDSPSNPEGKQSRHMPSGHLHWDAVYHNKIYNANLGTYPSHKTMVGSYSKLLGLTGARVGWIATNDKILFDILSSISVYDTATVSVPSQRLILNILNCIDLDSFMDLGKASLDSNRTEMQKLTKFFEGQDIQSKGMFYMAKEPSEKTLKLLDKSGVNYVILKDGSLRLSLGQKLNVVKGAVKEIIKNDRV